MFQVYCFFFHHVIIVIKLAVESRVSTKASDLLTTASASDGLSAGPQLKLPPGPPPLT